MSPEKTVTGVAKQPIDVVWRLITSPKKYHGLGIPHTYEPFESVSGQPYAGATFPACSLMGHRWTMHVIDCSPPTEFSFGADSQEWTYHFKLRSLGSSTEIIFTRRFRKLGWFERLRKGSQDENYHGLAITTLGTLQDACERLSQGQEDGIFES